MTDTTAHEDFHLDETPEPHPLFHRRQPIGVTYFLIALNVLIFLAMIVSGVPFLSPGAQQVLPWGADFGPLTASGQWWRLVTACFLHFGILHIAMNMYILLQVGVFAELLYGRARFLFLYLLAGVGGNVAGLYFHPFVVAAGASGAIFGCYGAVLAFLLVRRGIIPKAAAVSIVRSAGIFIVYNFVLGLRSTQTDMVAHAGGLGTGFLFGCALAWTLAGSSAQARAQRTGIASVGCMGALLAAIVLLPKSDASQAAFYRLMTSSPSITVGQHDQVFYAGAATKADATRVGQALVHVGFFARKNVQALFNKDATGSSISFEFTADEDRPKTVDNFTSKIVDGKTVVEHHPEPARPLPWNDPSLLAYFRTVGPQLASAAGGPPFTIRLLNSTGSLRNEVKIDASDLPIGANNHIYYSGKLTLAQAQALGAALQASGFLQGKNTIVLVAKSDSATDISFIVKANSWNDPHVVAALARVCRQIAPAVGGLPITLHLLDDAWDDEKQTVVQ